MTTKDEALKLAREAITATVGTHGFAFSIEKAKDKAIKAIDAALAEQDSEYPVRWASALAEIAEMIGMPVGSSLSDAPKYLAAKLAQQDNEPVWIHPHHLEQARKAPFLCRVEPYKRDDFVALHTTPRPAPAVQSDIPKIGCVNHDCDKCKAAVQPLTGWQPIETAPKEELEPFLVFVPWDYIGDGVVIQVSMFEGRMWPDGKESCIDWNDAITNATHWMPRKKPE